MRIKAVAFDIGHTLVRYNNPLNWKTLYAPALEQVMKTCGIAPSGGQIEAAKAVLTKYNTRENPREYEVSADLIFQEIFDAWQQPYERLGAAKSAFYGFFQAGAVCYSDAAETLRRLRLQNIKTGVLTDVAYGMENAYSLQDIAPIRGLIDVALTSVDVGYRKPNQAGYSMLLRAFDTAPPEMLYIGDEEKDVAGANSLGVVSVLICRDGGCPDWGQTFTIHSLLEILELL